MSTGNTLN